MDEDDKENMQVEDQTTTVFMDGGNCLDVKVVVNTSNSQGKILFPPPDFLPFSQLYCLISHNVNNLLLSI